MKFTDTSNITSAMRETHRYTVTRFHDGAERVQDSKPRIDQNNAHLYLVWDNMNNCQA